MHITAYYFLPALCFGLLLLAELVFPTIEQNHQYGKVDWVLNILGLFIQGALIPVAGLVFGQYILKQFFPEYEGILNIGWLGGFLLNFIVVDFLYYWQHRAFHHVPRLWRLHVCHHYTPKVNIWATSRNNLWINFLFVYLMVNACLAFACKNPQGFVLGAMLTASLDILRHTQVDFSWISGAKPFHWLGEIFVTPLMHRSHHNAEKVGHNFAANLIIWDKLFGTYTKSCDKISHYRPKKTISFKQQFWYPILQDKVDHASSPRTNTNKKFT